MGRILAESLRGRLPPPPVYLSCAETSSTFSEEASTVEPAATWKQSQNQPITVFWTNKFTYKFFQTWTIIIRGVWRSAGCGLKAVCWSDHFALFGDRYSTLFITRMGANWHTQSSLRSLWHKHKKINIFLPVHTTHIQILTVHVHVHIHSYINSSQIYVQGADDKLGKIIWKHSN